MNKQNTIELIELIIKKKEVEKEIDKEVEEMMKENPYAFREGWYPDIKGKLDDIKEKINNLD